MSPAKYNNIEWTDLSEIFKKIKFDFDKSYKCLNKTKLPSAQTQLKHITDLINKHNEVAELLKDTFHVLSEQYKVSVAEFFKSFKDRLEILFERLDLDITIPRDLMTSIENNISEKSLVSDSAGTSTEIGNEIKDPKNMADTVANFLTSAAKLLPDFDGTYINLQRFIDAINLVNLIKSTHDEVAVSLIKSKLTGTARNLITTENTIAEIVAKLKSSIKSEDTQAVTAKLVNAKQNNKPTNEYVEEIETLTKQLEMAYISDGLSSEIAKKYSTQTAVKALTKNAKSDKAKLLLQAGNFNQLSDIVTKFVELSNEAEDVFRINMVQYNPNYRNNPRRNSNRGSSRYNYRGRGGRDNNNNNQQQRRSYNQNRNYQRNRNNNQNQNNGRNGNRNVRAIDAASENGYSPQQAQLGTYQAVMPEPSAQNQY